MTTPTPEQIHSRRWATLGVLCLSLLVVVVDGSIVNVALPTLVRHLHASTSALQWVVDAYTLAVAGLLLTLGSLGDRIGRHRTLAGGLLVFGLGSATAAMSTSASELVACRVVMGIGAAAVMPATLSILTNVFTVPAERAKAIGLVNDVAADAEGVLKVANELALEIAANSPLAVQGTKAILAANEGRTVAEGLDYVATWNAGMLGSHDLVEAMTAFMERRAPNFTGS